MDNLLNTKQAAKQLGISVRRVLSLIKEDKLKSTKLGRDHVIREADLENVTIYGKRGRPPKKRKDKGKNTEN